ncbi:ABC transporter ATP-binding protein [Ancylobacter sp. A5.8]|uniref:ABC transporter ATP-binding protein n=1 Tax=Ancylobacter gelatini TaxID=2919920 RepID=UPI001F4EEBE6|nr:ABC transporter ATP-binding protein [Ancylobacter gelatini]MCJ8142294.1 ABC transporter ATP-binding protein [Ancylobacter gelatini]
MTSLSLVENGRGARAPSPAGHMPDAYLAVERVTKSYRGVDVLSNLDLAVGQGEFVSLLGPSGCGKTTLLRLIAGLIGIDGGQVLLGGRELTRLPAHRRNVGVVFQNYAPFPHLSVFDNVAFGLRAQRAASETIRPTVERFLSLVQLSHLVDRSAKALSGGQQQRVAVARALAVKPGLLLLDEPFSALDRKLRESMQIDLRMLLRELGITAIFVTHDQDEALVMSDRIAVMNAGRIEQFADPATIYRRPATPFVLDFVGSSTRFPGKVVDAKEGEVVVETARGRFRAPANFITGASVFVAVRPENIRLAPPGEDDSGLELTLVERIFLGPRSVLQLAFTDGERLSIDVPARLAEPLAIGGPVPLAWAVSDTLALPVQ